MWHIDPVSIVVVYKTHREDELIRHEIVDEAHPSRVDHNKLLTVSREINGADGVFDFNQFHRKRIVNEHTKHATVRHADQHALAARRSGRHAQKLYIYILYIIFKSEVFSHTIRENI